MEKRTFQLFPIPILLLLSHLAILMAITSVLLLLLPQPAFAREYQASKNDAEALILFKKTVQRHPGSALSGWKPSRNACNWKGITCTTLGRVTQIDLSHAGLIGAISDLYPLSSLGMLSVLDLSHNSLSLNSSSLLQLPPSLERLDLSAAVLVGSVPDGLFSRYPNLVWVDLSRNNLTGFLPESVLANADNLQSLDLSFNNLSGSISGLEFGSSNCRSLLNFDVSGNRFWDVIPFSLSNCSGLRNLNLSFNMFAGEIPRSLGEIRDLQTLDLSHNHLIGSIPEELGNDCESLLQLRISTNNISGSLPVSLSACSSLQILDLANNNISGPFPDSLLQDHASLEQLLVSNNFISGPIPSSLSSCKTLKVADFSSNKLSGVIPPDICPGAASLEELRLPDNLIIGEIPARLSSCSRLKTIDLSINYLTGPIPAELGRLENLEHFMVWFNGLTGKIPPQLGRCSKLKNLILNNNFFHGSIPVELFNCSNLEWISLTSNGITGRIPPQFGLLSRLAVLQLANNSLSGEIPSELGNCSSLVWLDLNSNRLTGRVPPRLGRQLGAKALSGILSGNTLAFVRNVGNACKGVGGLLEFAGIRPERLLQVPTLKTCDFTRLYSGAALSDWTHYQTLEYLDLSYNDLRGRIPDEFGDMVVLQVLDLAHNKLTGEIPASLGKLRNLGVFDASHNRLQGRIPDSFSNLSFLVEIDLSDNALTGPIPSLGQLSTLPASQYRNNPGLCGVPLPPCQQGFPPTVPSPAEDAGRRRRGASSWANSVILGMMISLAAVCVLIVWGIAMRARRREAREVRMLNSLQAARAATTWKIGKEKEPLSINVATFQRQLRKLTFSALIEATNGFSADSLIGCGGFGEVFKATLKDGSSVAIKKLIRLSYDEMEARVSDFGMARLISALDTHLSVSTLAGTPGYVPPEYYQSFRCTAKGDVYSFGVVLLELLTGKRPTDKEDFGDTNLVGWVKMRVREGRGREVIDPELAPVHPDGSAAGEEGEGEEKREMLRYLEITMQCVDDFPSKRPNMLQVVAMLRDLTSADGEGKSA
ncbi:hypothetical protein H6P81_002166 [Aristolochia fimbriata]|uniref:non-specific serine/threonine protein kinase n=1 Tax=Aristolochia fimbriata TaxID=158543 RepID=A0AAV7F9A3_ARIFI|nr:hypothetical protein H6P81_002166 [Aristolochia fimbriata]